MEHDVHVCMRPGRRRSFKGGGISRHRGELVVPKPSKDFLGCLHSDEIGRQTRRKGSPVRVGESVVGSAEPAANEQDIPRAERNALVTDYALEVFKRDTDRGQGLELDGILQSPIGII